MKNTKDCPICEKELISDIGEGCRMCGMPLNNKIDKFCSKKCEIDHETIHRNMMRSILGGELVQ